MFSVHQSLCSFLGSVGRFCMNDGASWEGNWDQPGLGWIVSRRQGIAGEREEENEEKDKWSASFHGGILSAS
jgi:hypothetical protein